ncbi:hypothetical protein [Candidatus Ferrigenium straubiae]|jgi:hypothetical protein|uniref:hypothetical protein n=1 Tax=Candidatus Ferrigenium straubiae TaxID=2919506 RepID=UPI003F4A9E92
MSEAERLNADCHAATLDRAALRRAMQGEGEAWYDLVTERCPHLFADVAVFVTAAQMRQMRAVIEAVERVVRLPGWEQSSAPDSALGVFYGYDFHLNSDGAHLIEINSNAGGGLLNALLLDSQREAILPVHADASPDSAQGTPSVSKHESSPFDISGQTDVSLNDVFLAMFRNEWRLARSGVPLQAVAIVDEQPEAQYLYPEFLLAQKMFGRAGIMACIADPSALQLRGNELYLGEQKIDLVYNRLTDFSLQKYPALRQAYLEGGAVVTPGPAHYARYADKRKLARLTGAEGLRALGASEADIATLLAGVPQTRLVQAADHDRWWQERKHWFFKPAAGYGSKGSYSGAKLTKRVFEEIMRGGYVAQRMAAPGERMVCVEGAEPQPLKCDVRCYVYDRRVQLVVARLYQGQTTNFRTPGGGFAVVRVVE